MAGASDRIDDFFVASSLPWLPEEPIGSFRRACDPMVDLIEPHLTLVFAVPASVRFDVFRAHVRDVASQTTPFDIRLNGLEKSWDGYLLLLVAEGREEVVALHDALYSGILRPYLWTGGPYVPHVTIGRFIAEPDAHDLLEPRPRRLDSDRFEDALFKAESLDLDYEGRLDSVQIFGADEDLTHVARLEEIRLGDAVSS